MKVQFGVLIATLVSFQVMAQAQLVSTAQTAPKGQKESEVQVDRKCLPLFGELRKTSEQYEEEIRFLSDCDKAFSTREEASKFFAARGWEYLQEGQLDTAAYRFNLCYLLDGKNVEAYWGLGVICYQKLNFEDSKRMLKKGVDLTPENVALLVDLTTVEIKNYETNKAQPDLDEAREILQHAVKLDSTYAQTHYNLSLVEFYKEDYPKSWEHLHAGRLLNMSLINLQFIQELTAKLPDPMGFFKSTP